MSSLYLIKEQAWCDNIRWCRTNVYDLRYTDITAMSRIAQSTMSYYDSYGDIVSPFIIMSKKIADMYCTDIDRLCSFFIYIDIEENLQMMAKFIKRVECVDVSEYRDKIYSIIDSRPYLSINDTYTILSGYFKKIINNFCTEGKYATVDDDPSVLKNFTTNYNYLMENTKTSYRKIIGACDISMGTLTRLKNGSEPGLSVVIKLADFFGVSISQILSPKPKFNLIEINNEIKTKKTIANKGDEISENTFAKMHGYIHWNNPSESKKLADEYLNLIDINSPDNKKSQAKNGVDTL